MALNRETCHLESYPLLTSKQKFHFSIDSKYKNGSQFDSVQTEAEFCPPAEAGAPAHKLQVFPAGDEAPVTPLLHPKAPVTPKPLVITGGLKSS